MPCADFEAYQEAQQQCQQLFVHCNYTWLLCRLQMLGEVSSHLTLTPTIRTSCTCLPLTTLILTTICVSVCAMLPDGLPGVLCVFSLNSWVSCLNACSAVTNLMMATIRWFSMSCLVVAVLSVTLVLLPRHCQPVVLLMPCAACCRLPSSSRTCWQAPS